MNVPKKLEPIWNHLSEFVEETCKDRDASHGHAHMLAVAQHALAICTELFGEVNDENFEIFKLTILSAWLHDIADHKYDKDGKLSYKLQEFLHTNYQEEAPLVVAIIDRISYSKEVKARANNALDWHAVLGDKGMLIRDIVSDADKLEALGNQGVDRCLEFARVLHHRDHQCEPSHEKLVELVEEHAHDKLYKIKDQFIRTEPGKKRAEPLHDELVEGIEKLKKGTN